MINFKEAFPRHSVELQLSDFNVLLKTLLTGKIFKGKESRMFQKKFGDYIQGKYAHLMQSGRLGIYLALKSFNLEPGTEVIIPVYTHYSLPMIVRACFLKPVPVDVEIDSCNINPDLIEEKISDKTKVLLISHLNGMPCKMKKIMQICEKYNLKLVEDCAQSLGAEYDGKKVGTFGTVGCFSLSVGKVLTGFGGGIVVTGDKNISEEISNQINKLPEVEISFLYRKIIFGIIAFFATRPLIFTFILFPFFRILERIKPGLVDKLSAEKNYTIYNSQFAKNIGYRMANIQAAVALNQLGKVDFWNRKRLENAQLLCQLLQQTKDLIIYKPDEEKRYKNVFLHYNLYLKDSRKVSLFRKYLLRKGIDTKIENLLDCKKIDFLSDTKGSFPVVRKLEGNVVQLPNSPLLQKKDIQKIGHYIIMVCNVLFNNRKV